MHHPVRQRKTRDTRKTRHAEIIHGCI